MHVKAIFPIVLFIAYFGEIGGESSYMLQPYMCWIKGGIRTQIMSRADEVKDDCIGMALDVTGLSTSFWTSKIRYGWIKDGLLGEKVEVCIVGEMINPITWRGTDRPDMKSCFDFIEEKIVHRNLDGTVLRSKTDNKKTETDKPKIITSGTHGKVALNIRVKRKKLNSTCYIPQ